MGFFFSLFSTQDRPVQRTALDQGLSFILIVLLFTQPLNVILSGFFLPLLFLCMPLFSQPIQTLLSLSLYRLPNSAQDRSSTQDRPVQPLFSPYTGPSCVCCFFFRFTLLPIKLLAIIKSIVST